MAKVHRIPLAGPFWSLEILEIDAFDTNAAGEATGVKRLYLVDPRSSRGLQLIKTQRRAPAMATLARSIADESGHEKSEVVE